MFVCFFLCAFVQLAMYFCIVFAVVNRCAPVAWEETVLLTTVRINKKSNQRQSANSSTLL